METDDTFVYAYIASPLDTEMEYVDDKLFLDEDNEVILCDDVPAMFEIPRPAPPQIGINELMHQAFHFHVDEAFTTPHGSGAPDIVEAEFAISTVSP